MNIYIDESGSMTTQYTKDFPIFIITKVLVKDERKLKRILKRFIAKNINELKKIDCDKKMFKDEKFKELKGSCLTKKLKLSLVKELISHENLFEIFFIKINNKDITNNLYNNTARAFNYVLGLSLQHNLKNKNLKETSYSLVIDNRNTSHQSTNSLEDYLNIKLSYECNLINKLTVTYMDSANHPLIQVADFFSNLYFSQERTNSYTKIFKELREKKYVHEDFVFPLIK